MRIRGAGRAVAFAIALSAVPGMAAQPPVVAPVTAVAQGAPLATPATDAPARPNRRHAKGDSLEGFNRAMFSVHQVLDRILFRPVAMAYKAVVPKIVRKGIRHILSNIGEPLVFANDVLQLKPKRAVKTLGRFVVNSTVGIGGVLDLAKTRDFRLPHRDNSFGDTLGHYGVGPGPYLFLPFVGPSDLRDFGAGVLQSQALPLAIGAPFDRADVQIAQGVLTGLDLRVESDDALKALLGSAIDPYATLRSAYLQDRAATIAAVRGAAKPSADPLDDPLREPGAGSVEPTSPPVDDFPADPAPPSEAEAEAGPQAGPVPMPAPEPLPAP